MKKETVIAKLRGEISLTDEFREFLSQFEDNDNAWFARQGGDIFLGEFGHEWNSNFVEVVQTFFDKHFVNIGLPEENLPKVNVVDSRRGSWIVDAALTMFGTVGTVYTLLKGVSELPAIADGLEETKNRLTKELSERFRTKIPERIEPIISNFNPPTSPAKSLPPNPVNVAFSIDARPLRGLTPDTFKTHAIHLSVGVSRSALSVENLGDTMIENFKIGLFKGPTQRNNWNFADAYAKTVPCLSPSGGFRFLGYGITVKVTVPPQCRQHGSGFCVGSGTQTRNSR